MPAGATQDWAVPAGDGIGEKLVHTLACLTNQRIAVEGLIDDCSLSICLSDADCRAAAPHLHPGISQLSLDRRMEDDGLLRIWYVAGTVGYERPPTRRSMKVFLGYAHSDAALAERVCKALADNGLEVSD